MAEKKDFSFSEALENIFKSIYQVSYSEAYDENGWTTKKP